MLVECATTSTSTAIITSNYTSTYSPVTVSLASSVTSTSCTTTSSATQSVCSSKPSNASSSGNCTAQSSSAVIDNMSSGSSNSFNNSLGNSLSTNSNSISNSNSIGNSWRGVKNGSSSSHCNGSGGAACEDPWRLQSEVVGGGVADSPVSARSSSTTGPLHKVSSDTTGRYMKYSSPLSESKISKKSNGKAYSESKSVTNMVDVEACLANTPPHLLIRSLSSLSHHSTQLSTLPRPQEQETVSY